MRSRSRVRGPQRSCTDPARLRFDPVERSEQIFGREGRLDQPHRVQVWILVGASDGSGLVERRHLEQRSNSPETVESHPQKSEPVSEIRSEPDGRPDHDL